jgi:DNA-binding NtrC family response regulator
MRMIAPNIRIIASSGLRPVGQLAAEIGAGGLGFLQKPYTAEQLLAHLARLLQVRPMAS